MVLSDSEKMTALVELAGAVAHELNNIFTAVTGNIALLEDELPPDTKARLGDVLRTAERGIALSSKLQAFAGRQPLRRRKVEVNSLVARVVRDIPAEALNGIHLRLSLSRTEAHCHVDEDKLRLSLEEILCNARAAMPSGGRIIVETRLPGDGTTPPLRPGNDLMIAISDTGKGMDPQVAARAVDPLFSTKRPGIHAGWGLSACAGFVRQSGGYMTLASKPGVGTRVEIHLPLQGG